MASRRGAAAAALLLAAVSLPAQAPTPPAADATTPAFRERQQRRGAFRNPRVLDAIHDGVAWLRAHQDDDGRWDCDEFGKHDADGAHDGDGGGNKGYDIGVTSLALLALLAQADPAYDQACHQAAAWLIGQIDAKTGRVPAATHDFLYDQALATLALAETAELLDSTDARTAANGCLRYLESHRNPHGAWRYQPHDGDNDSSLSSWCIAASAACRSAGLGASPTAVGKALAWFETVTNQSIGRTGYSRRDDISARMPGEHVKRFPAALGEATTAAAIHARSVVGLSVPYGERSELRLLARLPVADPPAVDFYYWLHGSQAFGPLAGTPAAKAWEGALHRALLDSQQKKGTAKGSWDPTDVWGAPGGRVYATAANVLALSAPFRCRRVDADFVVPDVPPWRRVHGLWSDGKYGEASAEAAKIDATAPADAAVRARLDWHLAVYVARAETLLGNADVVAPELLDRHELFDALARDLLPLPIGAEAAQQVAAMEKDPKVRVEVQASTELRKLRADYDAVVSTKNKPKRDKVRKQLEKLVDRFGDTAAAAVARDLIERLR